MRLSIPLRRFVGSILLVLYTTFTLMSGSLVLCQEADGTVNVEWRGSACCRPGTPPGEPSASQSAVSQSSEEEDDCGGCDDAEITTDALARSSRAALAVPAKAPCVPAPLPALTVALQRVWVDARDPRSRHTRAPLPPPPLAALRSVVLRC